MEKDCRFIHSVLTCSSRPIRKRNLVARRGLFGSTSLSLMRFTPAPVSTSNRPLCSIPGNLTRTCRIRLLGAGIRVMRWLRSLGACAVVCLPGPVENLLSGSYFYDARAFHSQYTSPYCLMAFYGRSGCHRVSKEDVSLHQASVDQLFDVSDGSLGSEARLLVPFFVPRLMFAAYWCKRRVEFRDQGCGYMCP